MVMRKVTILTEGYKLPLNAFQIFSSVYLLKKFRLQSMTELSSSFPFTSPTSRAANWVPNVTHHTTELIRDFEKTDRHLGYIHNIPAEHRWKHFPINFTFYHPFPQMFSQTSEDTGAAKYVTGLLFNGTVQLLHNLFLKFYVFNHVKITKCVSPHTKAFSKSLQTGSNTALYRLLTELKDYKHLHLQVNFGVVINQTLYVRATCQVSRKRSSSSRCRLVLNPRIKINHWATRKKCIFWYKKNSSTIVNKRKQIESGKHFSSLAPLKFDTDG